MTALGLGATAALGVLIGAAAVVRGGRRRLRAIDATVGFGAGFLLALVLLSLVPEVIGKLGFAGAVAVLSGYLVVLLAQQFVAPHFHFGEERHTVSRASAMSAVFALALHGLFDGIGIGSGLQVAPSLGVLFFIGVVLHKLPEGVTVASLMVASGWERGMVVATVVIVALTTPIGAAVGSLGDSVAPYGLGAAAGAALYVAASNLVPEMESRGRKTMVITVFAGVAAFLLFRALVGAHR